MTTMSVYQELDQTIKETRLVVIEPGLEHDALRCVMRTFSLLDRPLPAYETISYVWGDASLQGNVYINEQKVNVPSSAEVVLRNLRHPGRERTVWIDSLCIDQTNADDSNYQVQLMCDIYSNTTMGLIWLGEDNGHGQEIFEAIHALYDEARLETNDFQNFKDTVWPGWWDTYKRPSAVKFRPDRFADFFNLPWFSRLWVVQEAALAAQSICYYGSHTISLLFVLRSAIWLYSKSKSSQSPLSGHSGLARTVHIASYTDELFETPFRAKIDLLWMLNTLKQYDTSREEDHVYGLVGMYQQFLQHNKPLPQRLIPDYGRPLKYVLCNATKLAIEELQRLDPLLYICHRTTDELEHDPLPSWVPKWHRKQDLKIDHFPLNYKFRASQDSEAWVQPAEADSLETLIVKGFILDVVENLTGNFSHKALHTDDQLRDLLASAESLCAPVNNLPGDLEHALVASLDHRRVPMSRKQSTEGYHALVEHLSRGSQGTILPSDEHEDNVESNTGRDYHEALVRWMQNRRLFVTTHGYIGTGPQIMQCGDLITILYGSTMPIVLRQVKDSYAVVGQAYVSGKMFGEAVEVHRDMKSKDTTFTLI